MTQNSSQPIRESKLMYAFEDTADSLSWLYP